MTQTESVTNASVLVIVTQMFALLVQMMFVKYAIVVEQVPIKTYPIHL